MDRVDRIVRLAARALRAARAVFSHAPDFVDDAVACIGAPVRADDGEMLGTLYVLDDVDRSWSADDVAMLEDLAVGLAAEIELEHAQAKLDDYLERTDVLVQLASPDGRLLFVNRAWRAALGFQRTEVCAADIIAPDCRGVFLGAVHHVLSGHEVPPFDTAFVSKGGARLLMRAVLRARFEHGAPVSVRGTFEDITARLETDDAQTRLVEVLEATTDFVGIANTSGQAVYINRAGRALIGIGPSDDLSSVSMNTVYTRAGRMQLLRTAIPAALKRRTWQGESSIRTRAGAVIPVSQVLVAHESSSGGWYFSTILRDISAQKQKEDEARLLERLNDGIGDAEDLHIALVVALDLLCQVTGWTYAEVWLPDETNSALTLGPVWCQPTPGLVALARTRRQRRHPRGPEGGIAGRVWASGKPEWMTIDVTDPSQPQAVLAIAGGIAASVGVPVMADDELLAVLVFGTTTFDRHDEAKHRLVTVVAGRLGALMRRKLAEDALRASEERFRRLAIASNDGVVITRDGKFLEVNAAWSRMCGYPDGEVPSFAVDDYADPADRDEVVRRTHQNIEGTYYATLVRKDGSTFEAEITGKPCIYEGSPARISVIRDVTEWRRVDRMKNEFVSTVSHELRTPLTSIRGALGLLEGGVGGAMAPKAMDLLRMARENSDRLIRLINELLDLDKIEAGKLELKYVTLTPAAVVRATLDGIAGMADEHKIRLVEHVEAHRSFVADRDRIVQVLTNLISNAIKFSPAGSAVDIEATAVSTMVRFAVHNLGPGIAPADRARLFARFQQLDSGDNRRRGGTGLGLAISKAIVEQHGGYIGVQSEPDVRTTFWFEIPIKRVTRA
jgi:PAS domain S-box-containing protein